LFSQVKKYNNTSASKSDDWIYGQYEIELFGFMEARQGWRLQDDPFYLIMNKNTLFQLLILNFITTTNYR